MALLNQNITMSQGDEITISFDLTGSTDITGETITWNMARDLSQTVDVTKDTNDGVTITNGSERQLDVTLVKADTNTLTPGFYQHELIVDISGTEITEARGTIQLLPSSK